MTDDDHDAAGHGAHREEFHDDPLDHAEVWAEMSVGDLATEYGKAGIGAAELSRAVDIYSEMLGDDDVTNFFGLAGAMVPGGMRRVVSDLIRDGHIDVLVTTGANLTHDAIEAIGGKHHHGRTAEEGDEREHDEQLRDEGVDRIYNVYLPQEHFTLFEGHLRDEVFPAFDGPVAISEFTRELGRANLDANADVTEDPGIAAAAYEHDVPIFVPAIQDSVLGIQAWMHSQVSEFTLDALADMTNITDIAFDAEQAGATVVGGGVPKNFVLQTMLTVPEAYDYGVQLTTDPASTGGLSGATLDEARSWGKLEKSAKNVTVLGDATITLPFLAAAARDRIE
ncbi:deoxyhypusine synthase [Haloplanus halobius]|uniref:deoxyhypusine synthase n=1 Tax=Haloplanus halobius TaxID=2934938 RepID=UPI00200E0571|nr:deoxyhypusine synthase [Haloplanus sp. XH21]